MTRHKCSGRTDPFGLLLLLLVLALSVTLVIQAQASAPGFATARLQSGDCAGVKTPCDRPH